MNYTYHSKTILRTPIKPVKTSFTIEEIQQYYSQKEMQEALFLSSPNLLNEFIKWKKGKLTDKEEEKRLIYSLLKYALRMHSRCTPFGLFAGCGVIRNVNGNIIIDRKKKRSTRLDMNFTCALAQELAKLPIVQRHLKFYPNTSLYNLQDKIRYIEYYYKDKRRVHQVSGVDSSTYLQKILEKAKSGATLEGLATVILDEKISIEEALGFVGQITNSQLLVGELEPSITGDELLSQILKVLASIEEKESNKELKSIIDILQDTQNQLSRIDQQFSNNISIYEDLAENLKQLNIPFELSKLFQTDLYISAKKEVEHNNIDTISDQLTKAITILNQLTSSPRKTNLSEFQKKFYERYEDKEVLLLDALDIETGIGYAQNTNHTGDVNPLVNELILPYDDNQDTELVWSKKQSFLFRKLLAAQHSKQKIISIKSSDLKEFNANWDDLSDSFSVMYKHVGKRDGKNLLCINHVGGSSATYLLGRFASSNHEISEIVNEIAETEQKNNPSVIFAEIAHLPESRTGNILIRPAFRKYEIPYLSNSSLPKEQQITLDDLYISVKSNRIFLRSKRLNKKIVPRLGNAHNYSFNALPVYHFLCDLQTQNTRGGLYFDWGNLVPEFSFLPRVEIGNVIVSIATWQLKKKEYEILFKKGINLTEELLIWQQRWELPDLVLLADGDNELLINLKDELNVKMFVSIIKKRPNIVLKEFLFNEKEAIIKDEKGNAYTNEFITILQKNKKKSLPREVLTKKVKKDKKEQANNDIVLPRSFSLGSEWLYYKIYCGVKTADKVLAEVIKPLTERLIELTLIDSWFFIRYADPDIHLRVRFHFTDLKNIGIVITLFQNAISEYEKSGSIWKIQTDTYQREIERYGENTMLLGEQIFHYDSQCIVNMLDMIDGDEGEEIRWLFAIRAVNELLSNFNYTSDHKRHLLEYLKTGFSKEFKMNKDLKMQMDKRFRKNRKSITDILDTKNDKTSELQPLFELLNEKSANINPMVNQILRLDQNNELPLSLNDLLASYIHMLLNRLFKSKQRLHEMVVYDFMWRTYHSEIAKQKHLSKELVK